MHIAIIGAGFCGLAVAFNLLQQNHKVSLFDPLEIGTGTSGIAAGLLHKYVGARGKKNLDGDSSLEATLKLLQIAEETLGEQIFEKTGLFRPAITPEQKIDFQQTALLNEGVFWLNERDCLNKFEGILPNEGIFISGAYIVDCPRYLKGLWMYCQINGASFERKKIHSLKELETFDKIIVTMGYASNTFPELASLKITPVKGQLLELTPTTINPLPSIPVSSQGYLLKSPQANTLIAGATYEKDFDTLEPNKEKAKAEIFKKITPFISLLDNYKLTNCRSGIRASTNNHLPFIQNFSNKIIILTGMGSKGLLYHALWAKKLTTDIQ